jgi:hypothetical protein
MESLNATGQLQGPAGLRNISQRVRVLHDDEVVYTGDHGIAHHNLSFAAGGVERSVAKPLALSARIPGVSFRVTTLFLFLLLRFHDLVPVTQRRLEWMLLGGMLEARG